MSNSFSRRDRYPREHVTSEPTIRKALLLLLISSVSAKSSAILNPFAFVHPIVLYHRSGVRKNEKNFGWGAPSYRETRCYSSIIDGDGASDDINPDDTIASLNENHKETEPVMSGLEASHTSFPSQRPTQGVKSLGVDYGLSRTGLAVSSGYGFPQALEIVDSKDPSKLTERILEQIESWDIDQIVVGLPLHKNGTESDQTSLVREYCQTSLCPRILATFGLNEDGNAAATDAIPVLLWDERYTSKAAAARVHTRNPDQRLYGTIDAEAACLILDHYYTDTDTEGGAWSEIITVDEPDVRRACLAEYDSIQETLHRKAQQAMEMRDGILQRRQEMIDAAKAAAAAEAATDGSISSKKKKKKKRKR